MEFASITVRHADGRLTTSAPTHPLLRVVDAAQYELREGPCYDSVTDAVHVTSPWLAQDDRFPRYRSVAVEAGIRAQAGIRLFESDRSLGALNLYSTKDGAFQDLGFLGDLVTHQSAMALAYAREIDDLRQAVNARQLIGRRSGSRWSATSSPTRERSRSSTGSRTTPAPTCATSPERSSGLRRHAPTGEDGTPRT